jgi:hypothetical protein
MDPNNIFIKIYLYIILNIPIMMEKISLQTLMDVFLPLIKERYIVKEIFLLVKEYETGENKKNLNIQFKNTIKYIEKNSHESLIIIKKNNQPIKYINYSHIYENNNNKLIVDKFDNDNYNIYKKIIINNTIHKYVNISSYVFFCNKCYTLKELFEEDDGSYYDFIRRYFCSNCNKFIKNILCNVMITNDNYMLYSKIIELQHSRLTKNKDIYLDDVVSEDDNTYEYGYYTD